MSILSTSPAGSSAIGPASGGKVYPYNNLTTAPQVVARANQFRAAITFHNPGTVTLFVAPSVVQGNGSTAPNQLTDQPLVPSLSALGGCWMIPPGMSIIFVGESQGAFQAFASSGIGNPLTVSESNIS
jgi:hypothetical protein